MKALVSRCSVGICFAPLLLLSTTVSTTLAPRQETTEQPTLSTASAESDTAKPTTSLTDGGESVASFGTAAAKTTSSSTNARVTPMSKPLNSTNDPSRCHKDHPDEANQNVFCKPVEGETMYYDDDYKVTWDASLFPPNSTNAVEIYHTDFLHNTTLKFPETEEYSLFKSDSTANVNGQATISISKDFLSGNSSVNLTLLLAVSSPDQPIVANPGPTVLLVNRRGSNSSAEPDSHSGSGGEKKLGEKVGIPIGLIAFLVIIAALVFFVLRRRRAGSEYLTGKSQSQRTAAPGLVGPHRRQASFHDEPTRGVELQDRGGSADNWDWGSPTTSPTSGGNAFREEIGRQQKDRGW
ncbi:MAG: hypothetical protein Q9217_004508 [Psora testacea]